MFKEPRAKDEVSSRTRQSKQSAAKRGDFSRSDAEEEEEGGEEEEEEEATVLELFPRPFCRFSRLFGGSRVVASALASWTAR